MCRRAARRQCAAISAYFRILRLTQLATTTLFCTLGLLCRTLTHIGVSHCLRMSIFVPKVILSMLQDRQQSANYARLRLLEQIGLERRRPWGHRAASY